MDFYMDLLDNGHIMFYWSLDSACYTGNTLETYH